MQQPAEDTVDTFDFVLFGGSGDLSMRKLLPALYFRHCEGQLPSNCRILAIARADLSRAEFLEMLETDSRIHIDDADFYASCWQEFLDMIHYMRLDVTDQKDYAGLSDFLSAEPDRVRVFYLSTAPGLFSRICAGVYDAGLITPKSRVALEKPLGRDLESAQLINDELAQYFEEYQIFRIDHYLGKETVQNLLALRFGNVLFEPLWRRELINDVQITIAENLGVEGRAKFYDQTGALRDMVQNHLLQLLVILAMEPPASNHPDAVRDEKIKVLRALKPLVGNAVLENSVRGQYKAGAYLSGAVPGYLEDPDVPEGSRTETFVALRAEIESWRWSGVPFYLRTGKRMEDKITEIIINYRKVPHSIYDTADGFSTPNQLVIRLQPEESIKLRIYIKAWGDELNLQPVHLNLDFNDVFKKRQMIAYERLIMDLVRGDPTWFMRRDEVEAAWEWIDPIREAWDASTQDLKAYAAGSWGPAAANVLISREDLKWYEE
ncbi:MAG: glucose-6-phosphate dehydrogenase [Gammaproteobacteria bacterium]|nr:glucose-6-phosphate dehydrogenase [Gammaproteobacteria bacterium]